MHTSAGAACGRDDDGAPELFVCRSSQTMRVKETRLYVNKSIHQHLLDACNHVVIEKIEESGFVVWYAVRFCISRAVILGVFGFKDPRDFLRFQVDSVESALMRADVESIAGNGG